MTAPSPNDWPAAYAKAKEAVSKLDLDQKASLCTGIGWQKGVLSAVYIYEHNTEP